MQIQKSTILITGGTGLIGSALIQHFLSHSCHVIVLTRHPNKLKDEYPTDYVKGIQSLDQLPPQTLVDYVINLAGESIGGKRWSSQRKQSIINSRVHTTQKLVDWLQTLEQKPKRVLSGSAVGYYGINEQHNWQELDEDSPSQSIFVSELCQKWENAILPLEKMGFNLNIIRLGVVFSKKAPAFKQMLLPIKLNAVGKIASGQQPITWIHIEDVVNAICFLLARSTNNYLVYNLTAPDKNRQIDFVNTVSEILHKTPLLPLPETVLKLTLGEQAQLITNGQFVYPKHLLKDGYHFQYPSLELALQNLL